ncbi:DDE_3 domain-containing protein [Trichonephila clavipes]|nr:DDE_3 domain-containing protein [Trichonephila clavipes]
MIERILTSHCQAKRELLMKDLVILNHGQKLRTTLELAAPVLTTTPRKQQDVYKLSIDLAYLAPLHGADFLFMDEHARSQRANIVDECLQSEDITRMDWPSYSPDMSPMEHVWDMLGRRFAARQTPTTCLLELRRALLDEWCNIPQDQIDNVILSMPRRLHFWLNGYVNKQNCSIWSEANPLVYVETPLHPEKLIIWCALWAGGIIGPYFFKNDEGHNVTVNGDRYRAMITNFSFLN